MGQTLQSGNTSVTGNVSVNSTVTLPSPSATQTVITKNFAAGNDGATLHTVTAGKTFYCTGLTVAGNTSIGNVLIKVAGTTVLAWTNLINQSLPLSGGVLFTATAGQAITINGINNGYGCGSIWGYEQ